MAHLARAAGSRPRRSSGCLSTTCRLVCSCSMRSNEGGRLQLSVGKSTERGEAPTEGGAEDPSLAADGSGALLERALSAHVREHIEAFRLNDRAAAGLLPPRRFSEPMQQQAQGEEEDGHGMQVARPSGDWSSSAPLHRARGADCRRGGDARRRPCRAREAEDEQPRQQQTSSPRGAAANAAARPAANVAARPAANVAARPAANAPPRGQQARRRRAASSQRRRAASSQRRRAASRRCSSLPPNPCPPPRATISLPR